MYICIYVYAYTCIHDICLYVNMSIFIYAHISAYVSMQKGI